MEDREIISMLNERDERAIVGIQEKYRSYCRFIAKSILDNDEDAEECLNNTYLAVWNSIPPNAPRDLRSYVGAVCRKTALKQLERRMAKKRGEGRAIIAFEELDGVLGEGGDAADEIALRDALQKFLRSLSKRSRIVFIQKYWYFRTVGEIAKDLAMSEESVKASLFRSREKLKNHLKKEGFEI